MIVCNMMPRWATNGIYVNEVLVRDGGHFKNGWPKVNNNNGSSISVKKAGGWKAAWELALGISGWTKVP